jgi:hypothetical protein
MQSQDEVNAGAIQFLTAKGWKLVYERRARRPGRETELHRDGRRIFVAPTGEGSSLPSSRRFGQAFTRSQVYDHVANVTTRLLRALASGQTDGAALAVPDNADHNEAVGAMLDPLAKVNIGVLWVPMDGPVRPKVPWEV